jgi:hypothetical protein
VNESTPDLLNADDKAIGPKGGLEESEDGTGAVNARRREANGGIEAENLLLQEAGSAGHLKGA